MSITQCRARDSHVDVAITPTVDSVVLAETVIRWRGIEDTVPETAITSSWQGSPSLHAVYLFLERGEDRDELGLIHHEGDENVTELLPPGAELLTRIASWSLRTDEDTPETVEIHRVVIVPEPEPVVEEPAAEPAEEEAP